MAFTVDQNISGAAAFEAGVQGTSQNETNLAVVNNLLKFGEVLQKGVIANRTTATQTDRNSATFNNLLLKAKQDRAKGMSEDNLQQKYAAEFANLGLNPEQKGVTSQFFGEDIFITVKGPENVKNLQVELFEEQDRFIRLGKIQEQINLAAENGRTISQDEAAALAIDAYAIDVQAQAVGIIQGNRNFNKGFDQNMTTLESFTSALIAALGVEVEGGDLSLDTLNRLKAGFLELKGQRAFQKPTDKIGMKKWEAMNAKLKSIEATFEALEDYDFKNATAQSNQAIASIVLSGDGPFTAMALQNPDALARVVTTASQEVMNSLATATELTPIDYSTLNFDPIVLEFMGITDDAGSVTTSEIETSSVIPAAAVAEWDKLNKEQKTLSLNLHRHNISRLQPVDLADSASANLFATSVTTTAVALTQNEQYSSLNLDVLTSDSVIMNLNALERLGGASADMADTLRLQIGKALEHNQKIYGLKAVGKIQTLAGISLDKDTGKFMLDPNSSDPQIQGIAAVVDLYYGGNFEALWKAGTSAKETLRNRLAREGKFTTTDDLGYKQFDAATKVLQGPLFKGMAMRYSEFQGIPEQLARFKTVSKKLKVNLPPITTGPPLVEDTTGLNMGQGGGVYDKEIQVGEVVPLEELTADGSEESPWLIKNEQDYTKIPFDTYYRVGTDPTLRIKRRQ
jgi:hypothetical protein|tara:strand:- start:346 stop:2397 length:2052 start_codon:yes stop_codon:yes gene_type:complete